MPAVSVIAGAAAGRRLQRAVLEGSTRTPAWLSGLAVNGWHEFLGSSISSTPGIDGGASTSGKLDAWGATVVDQRDSKIHNRGSGGHGDYSGNEWDYFDAEQDEPAWVQGLASSPSSAVTSSSAYYSDGAPSSTHPYQCNIVSPQLNKIITFYGASLATVGSATQVLTALDLTSGTYDSAATWPTPVCPTGLGTNAGAYAIHPTTGVVMCWLYNAGIWTWDPADRLNLTALTGGGSLGGAAVSATAAAVDPTRGTGGTAFFLGGGAGMTMCHAVVFGTGTVRAITLTGSDISGWASGGFGLEYVPALDKFIVCLSTVAGGASIYAITPTTGDSWACAELTTTGGSGLPITWKPDTDPEIDTGAWAPRTKFGFAPRLGCALFVPRFASNVWALKLHEV